MLERIADASWPRSPDPHRLLPHSIDFRPAYQEPLESPCPLLRKLSDHLDITAVRPPRLARRRSSRTCWA